MSIVQIDRKTDYTKLLQTARTSWQQRFRKNLYQDNYKKYFRQQKKQDIFQEQIRNSAAYSLTQLINQGKQKSLSFYQQRKQFYDRQIHQTHYSPYSVLIPLQNQSYMNDQIVNTFSYMLYLKDTAKRNQLYNLYHQINNYFKDGKNKDQRYIKQQWMKLKYKFICDFDSIKAVSLLMEITRKNSQIFQGLYLNHGKNCLKEIFIYRITKVSLYIRPTMKIHSNLKISVQIGDQINQKTLPMVMKTWYCALCLCYDCEKHQLQSKATQYQHQYISIRNKKSQSDHIQNIIKILKFSEQLKRQSNMVDVQSKKQKTPCSPQCYLNLTKAEILKLFRFRHKLISPLAKSLLKMGIQMFSYNPCQISKIFQSKYDKNPQVSINCNQIFLNFVEESNLTQIINMKMKKSQDQYLQNESDKIINLNIKLPINQPKLKKTIYQQKRSKNQNPQLAVCMHNFIGHNSIDSKCEKCVCKERGFCLASCLCSQQCQIRRQGCFCKGLDSCQTQKCICFVNKLQCQPGICGECFAGKTNNLKKNCCRNDQILKQLNKRIYVGISQIPGAGLGAFAGQDYSKNDLVCKYSGQHINSDIDFLRQVMIKDLSFYNFDSPNGKTSNASIDARFMGNKARFINHGNQGEQNLRAQTIFSNGTQYIALFAKKDIKQGQQLSFNYDGNGILYAQHRDKYPFIKPPKKS